jgi:hydrogenase maturation protease
MDGGTQGLYLIQHVQACDLLIVFDEIDYGLEIKGLFSRHPFN